MPESVPAVCTEASMTIQQRGIHCLRVCLLCAQRPPYWYSNAESNT